MLAFDSNDLRRKCMLSSVWYTSLYALCLYIACYQPRSREDRRKQECRSLCIGVQCGGTVVEGGTVDVKLLVSQLVAQCAVYGL